jgi:hypothetical protein
VTHGKTTVPAVDAIVPVPFSFTTISALSMILHSLGSNVNVIVSSSLNTNTYIEKLSASITNPLSTSALAA